MSADADGSPPGPSSGAASPVDFRSGTTFILLHRTGCSAAASFVEVQPELVEGGPDILGAAAPSPGSPEATNVRVCYHLICSRQYKLGLTDRSPENTAMWSGALIRISLTYRDDGEQVLHAFVPNGGTVLDSNGTNGKRKKKNGLNSSPSPVPLAGFDGTNGVAGKDAQVGPLLRFQPGVRGAFRNAVPCREVLLRMGGEGETVGSFGFVATSFCHGRRAFCLRMDIEEGLPQLAVAGRLEFTTRTHQKGRTLPLSVFGPGGSAGSSGSEGGSSEDEGGPDSKRRTDDRSPEEHRAKAAASSYIGGLENLTLSDRRPAEPPPEVLDISEIGRHVYPPEAIAQVVAEWERALRDVLKNQSPSATAKNARFEELIPAEDEGGNALPDDPLGPLVPPRNVVVAPAPPPIAAFTPTSAASATENPIWFLQLTPQESNLALSAFRSALEGPDALSGPFGMPSATRALMNPRLLGTPLLSTLPGRYRLMQGIHRLVEIGESETAQQFIKAATGNLLAMPTVSKSIDAALAVRAILNFVDAGTGPVAPCSPHLCVLSEGPSLQLLGAARRILTGHEDALPEVYCEYLFRRAITEWQNEREHRALEGLFECWSTIVRLQLAPCRLEARLLHHLLHLSLRVPGNLALAKHLSSAVYWFEETVEDHVEKALCLSTLGLVDLARRNTMGALSYCDRAMATLQHVATYGDCYRQLFIRPVFLRAFVNIHANRLASALRDWRQGLILLKETCRIADPLWDIIYTGRAQYLRIRERERGQQLHSPRSTVSLFRSALLAIRLVDAKAETPLRAHALARTGELYMAIGAYAKAVACFEDSAVMLQSQYPRCFTAAHPYVALLRSLRDGAHARASVPRPPPSYHARIGGGPATFLGLPPALAT